LHNDLITFDPAGPTPLIRIEKNLYGFKKEGKNRFAKPIYKIICKNKASRHTEFISVKLRDWGIQELRD